MFNGCSSLTSISWGDGNANIDNVTFIGEGAFAGTAFTEFVFPKNVYSIEDYVFENCTSLETLSLYGNFEDEQILPEEEEEGEINYPCVDHNGNGCYELKGVQVIKEGALKGCSSLSTINLYDSNYEINSNPDISGYENTFTFPYSVMRCDGSSKQNSSHYTFAGTAPTKVVFSPNMQHIGAYAFYNVTSLTEVNVAQFENSKMLTIKASAFQGCSNLASIDLPHSILRIENSAFYGCENLNNVELNQLKINAINGGAFYNCQSIEHLKLPETVSSIKSDAFYRTYNLDYVVLPVAVTEVLDRAFMECRQNSSEKMKVFISRNYNAAHVGGKKINFGKNWHDASVDEYYLLLEGEQRVEGRNYWEPDASGNPVVI